jgi:hypothetical protein
MMTLFFNRITIPSILQGSWGTTWTR